ncbi:MAG: ATP-binding protein [Bryobacteraceae bacterium]|nr:ATP-binding protein [Bryobacteraceae bacterium]
MKRRLLYGAASVLLALCVTFVVWQGSFSTGGFDPENVSQIFLYWAVSSLVFILTVTLGFMLFRTGLKLYIDRQSNREGSRIRSKLVVGALALTFLPVLFLVLFSVQVLNFNLLRWFSRPAENIRIDLASTAAAFQSEMQAKADAQAKWLAATSAFAAIARDPASSRGPAVSLCREAGVVEAWIVRGDGARIAVCAPKANPPPTTVESGAMLADAEGLSASRLEIRTAVPLDLVRKQEEIQRSIQEFESLSQRRKEFRNFYIMLLALITLFILFVATWIALMLSRQISVPISALLGAAREVRGGNLGYRVRVAAVDELAALVRAFNEMTQDLESNERELERRRRFTEAILENIPTGVLSVSSEGRILKANHALQTIFPATIGHPPARLEDLFGREDVSEIRYLMKRARRTGIASRQFEVERDRQKVQLSVVVSAIEENVASGYVIVIEDSSELLRAQRAAAWQEVARRIAHEIKNPLTPIALAAERMSRQLKKLAAPGETQRILDECSATILQEVESVRVLVDEFSQFSRFPSTHPVPTDLNELVTNALGVFEGRLEGIQVSKSLAYGLPMVNVDPEQFKRVIVNLVDNAAEAMQDSPLKRLYVSTALASPDVVELSVTDTGRGVSPEDREKLFLPYFSTKGRGTGLGLAIVSQILSEHRAPIRVEDNEPAGTRFTIDVPTAVSGEVFAIESTTIRGEVGREVAG